MVKNLPAMQENQETWAQSLGWEAPLEKEMATHSSMLPEKLHGQRSMAGYSPRGSKELDMNEQLRTPVHTEVPIYSRTAAAAAAKLLQLCPTLCNPIDGLLPGSPIPGILQARTVEWVAISFSSA